MTQNMYDNATFFEGYSRLPRSVDGLEGAPEWPALRALLPELHGLRVLDLGCGFGWFCRWAREDGAARVLGVDVSQRMLARARAETHDPAISYARANLEDLDLPRGSYDLAYSSLALHYVENLTGLMAKVRAALVPGGKLIFSVEHPMFTAPTEPGWSVHGGRKTWPVDRYLDEGPRSTDWLAKGVIKQHRTLGTYINMLIRSGFAIAHVEEWVPTEEQIASQPSWANERQRPLFLLVACQRPMPCAARSVESGPLIES
jgi:SAM-dependent methyltransferase